MDRDCQVLHLGAVAPEDVRALHARTPVGAFAIVADEEGKHAMVKLPALAPVARPEHLGGNGDPGMTGTKCPGWPCSGHTVIVNCNVCPGGPPCSDRPCWAGCRADRKPGANNACMQWLMGEPESHPRRATLCLRNSLSSTMSALFGECLRSVRSGARDSGRLA